MPRIIRTIDDRLAMKVTFELDDGRFIAVEQGREDAYLERVLASLEVTRDTTPVDVIQYGRKVGELPSFWHPGIGKSSNWLYDFRRHDLRLVDGKWHVHPSVGASDLDYLIGFVRKDAQGIDARSGETAPNSAGSTEGESPVRDSECAQTPPEVS